jgi:transposase-like protein
MAKTRPAYPEQFRCEAVELVRQGRSMLAAIEAGVDAVLVGDRIRALKAERQRSPKSTTTGAEEPASTSTTPAPSSTGYPTSTTRSPQPTPSSGASLRCLPSQRRDRPKPGPDTTEGARLERLHGGD